MQQHNGAIFTKVNTLAEIALGIGLSFMYVLP
jgi:hypothetical protein